ncbi:hypothetical protein COT30_05395 [Candidatus Micrarchaeota archaeon CG08_land_8_20_14_0_20_49_17]|nr:MAG: hypothetical protein AUJ13_02290 [Candidatus Micrarchaeota archaeon CG1_02_49_24]PIU09241.1 MAG: hypothetical protein COT30_05395 [Candidatus Micrarchaeota archaeon CG08_land_8_20_14_0_20_49_17]PIZ99953.1 MAG: hypothetical protein COX84_00395 [Candidatus Micrarchaeota archaeon CG_4_10_14_0_2_um_filter_49_7]HII54379.1 cation transporter [Candidatus Micrarchaeota archaeon]
MAEKLNAAMASIGVNLSMALLKAAVAILTGSIGILAETLHSGLDLLASVFAYLGIKKATEPSDTTHHYGHHKFGNASSLLQGALLAITALFVIYEAINRLLHAAPIESLGAGLAVMLFSMVVAIITSRYLHEVSIREGSSVLEADATHFTSDVLGSIAVLAGLGMAAAGFPRETRSLQSWWGSSCSTCPMTFQAGQPACYSIWHRTEESSRRLKSR